MEIFWQQLTKGFLLIFIMIFANTLYAKTIDEHSPSTNYKDCPSFVGIPQTILVLQVGRFYANQGESQDIGIEGLIGDRFTIDDNGFDQNHLVGIGYYFKGYQREQFNLYFGLNAFYLAKTKVSGDVIQEELFNNLSYHYYIKNYPIYLAAKSLIPIHVGIKDTFMTLDLGMGPNFIKTSDVTEESNDEDFTIPDETFSGKTSTAFSATLGIGVQFRNLFNSIALEIGYRFFYLGKGHFEKENDQLTDTLDTGNSYANAIVITLTV